MLVMTYTDTHRNRRRIYVNNDMYPECSFNGRWTYGVTRPYSMQAQRLRINVEAY